MRAWTYAALLLASLALALAAAWSSLGTQIDNDAYDFMFRLAPAAVVRTESALLTIDEQSLAMTGGQRRLRGPLAEALEHVAAAGPRAVAMDVTLADAAEEAEDARLEAALRALPRLVLPSDLMPEGRGWVDPLPRFVRWAQAVGHVHAEPDRYDAVNREILLDKAAGQDRRWALALEAFRLGRGANVLESVREVEVGPLAVPRALRIRYIAPESIPRVTLHELLADPGRARVFAGRTVFVGITAQTAARDRLLTPYSGGRPMSGVEIHAQAFETLSRGRFLTDARAVWEVLGAVLLTASAGLVFRYLVGWRAHLAAAALLAAAHLLPYIFFTRGVVYSFTAPVSASWLSIVGAAGFQHFVVRRSLRRAEAERSRYQQAMHFVTHEMRTPLTAIQGSSELISRYPHLAEEKRRQIAQLITSESKRLGRMIEMFLNVERLSAGQMELRRENFAAGEMIRSCLERARPLADRKSIRLSTEPAPEDQTLAGDRELLEYAFYNLLTNAIKYSPRETEVTISIRHADHHLRIAVRDQGIGMDEKEVRKVFQKFYRTRRAEQSGETGTGIGLSIVEQIVSQHGGMVEVVSRPGQGSCFTLVMPVGAAATVQKT